MATSNQIFARANEQIIEDIKRELRLQGHHLTGALERSLTDHITAAGNDIHLTASALGYIEDLEKGIPANQIELNETTIAGMTRYVQLRMGYTGKTARQAAVAIIRKQQKEGNPTKGSYAFSQTGFRTEAVQDTFYQNDLKYNGLIDNAALEGLDDQFHLIKSGTI